MWVKKQQFELDMEQLTGLMLYYEKCQAGLITAGIKIAVRNMNHLRYADDNTLMVESEKDLGSLDEAERGG